MHLTKQTEQPMKRTLLITMTGFALSACAFSQMSKLPPHEQDLWRRCAESVAKAQGCYGSGSSQTFTAICGNELAKKYTEARDKKRFVIRNGCPRDMVD